MLSMVEYVHQRLSSYQGSIAVDFTMGNGNDTLFLAQNYEMVYAFDIQEEAVKKTQRKLLNYSNVTYILDNHKNLDYYLSSFDVGVFNLGYLPKSKSPITTELESTEIAINKAIDIMNQALFIVAYPGHKEGYKESKWLDSYVRKLDSRKYNVSTYRMLNKNHAPYVIEIEKR